MKAPPCAVVLDVAQQGKEKLEKVTVLTPRPDATRAEILEATGSAIGALALDDTALRKLAAAYAKALLAEATAVKAFAVVYESGQTPSPAVQKRVRDTGAGDETARRALVAYCRNASPSQ